MPIDYEEVCGATKGGKACVLKRHGDETPHCDSKGNTW